MADYCTHYECRCDQANELAFMSETLDRPKLLHKALDCFYIEVRCRKVPRKGPVAAPFPKEEA